jgi:hypothetical protein
VLLQAVKATFAQRDTKIGGDMPLVFSEEFKSDKNKQSQWQAFLNKSDLNAGAFVQVMNELLAFIQPVYDTAADDKDWRMVWIPDMREWVDK